MVWCQRFEGFTVYFEYTRYADDTAANVERTVVLGIVLVVA